ncbi:MAG: LPS export ABC transporter periplasmic protein LptC [Pseudomonadota bacterium]
MSWFDGMIDRIGPFSLGRGTAAPSGRGWRAREFALLRRRQGKRPLPRGALDEPDGGASFASDGNARNGRTGAAVSTVLPAAGMPSRLGPARALPSDPQRARIFRRAKRHSSMVRALRFGLPAVAVVLLAVLPLSAVNPTIPGIAGLSLDGIGFSGTTIVMENPRLNGYEKGRGGYRFEAERAEQSVAESNKVTLVGLEGRITQDDGRWASIRARHGVIDTEAETMQLDRDIIVRADGGYRALLQSAAVDLKDGNVLSNQPVQVDMLNGSVKSQSLELIERGRYIRFEGDVEMTIYLGSVSAPGDEQQPVAPSAVESAAQ